MQGNSLEKELDAFEDEDKLMTASAYVQQKSKLTPKCFEHILKMFNQRLVNVQLLDHQYRLFAIDGSDFNQLFNPNSKNIITNQFPSCTLMPSMICLIIPIMTVFSNLKLKWTNVQQLLTCLID